MKRVATLACVLVFGCNPVQRIALNTNEISSQAQALSDHGRHVGDQVVVERSTKIIDLAADIHATLPDVEARTPTWMTMLMWLAGAVVAIALCVILWQTGIGRAIKVLLGWIPAPIEREARLLKDVMDPNRQEDVREFVAARRASSPLFDLAWRKANAQPDATKETQHDDAR